MESVRNTDSRVFESPRSRTRGVGWMSAWRMVSSFSSKKAISGQLVSCSGGWALLKAIFGYCKSLSRRDKSLGLSRPESHSSNFSRSSLDKDEERLIRISSAIQFSTASSRLKTDLATALTNALRRLTPTTCSAIGCFPFTKDSASTEAFHNAAMSSKRPASS